MERNVDVLAVMDDDALDASAHREEMCSASDQEAYFAASREARAAVAELIEAAKGLAEVTSEPKPGCTCVSCAAKVSLISAINNATGAE